jgi:hypothetical protein
MRSTFLHAIGALIFIFNAQAFSQEEQLNVDGMRKDAAAPSATWYEIIDVKKTAETFEIVYDINASNTSDFDVSLVLLRESDPAFRIVPRKVSGKIGSGAFAGKNNVIVWNYRKDILKDLKGNDYHFELTVRKVEPGSFPWLWTGIGAVAA